MAYRDTSITIFYHVAQMGLWEKVDAEITACLNASGILDHAKLVRNECSNISLFEFPTIDMLRAHAASNDGMILYVHTKGVSRTGPSIDDWRACMLYWMVERWRECVDKLLKGHDVVGYTRCDRPLPHFQGNYWWARSSYIRTLGDPRKVQFIPSVSNQGERHKAEFWLLGNRKVKLYEAYNHRLRPYSDRNPRERYVGKSFA